MKLHTSLLSAALLATLLFSKTTPANASQTLFSDNFDDISLTGYSVVRNQQWGNPELPCMRNSTPAEWAVNNGALEIEIAGPPCVSEISPIDTDLSGSDSYKIEFDWILENQTQMDRNFALLWKDTDNWIGIKLLGDKLLIHRFTNGNYHIIPGSEVNFPFSGNQTYHFDITYAKDNKIVIKINDQLVVDTIDSDNTVYDGYYSFAFQASVGAISSSTTSFDNIVVTSLEDDTLGVNLIKQNELPWGPLEYDSATQWATASQGSTFSDWGCALTSAVMIMNFYGINQMPDGSPVNPLTLNNWLLANNGYVNGGNVSFPAISALTKILSDQYGHVALEYSRNDSIPREIAISEITQGKPVIVTKPGHFMVADGIVPNVSDLFIKDPLFAYNLFSKHAAAQISTRIFTPSHTDVSYLSIAADPSVEVQLYDITDHLVETNPVIEQLSDFGGSTGPAVQLIEIPKPATGTYRMQLTYSGTGTPTPTTITTISSTGEITTHSIPVSESQVQLTISSDAPSTIEYAQPEGFEKIRETLARLRASGGIKSQPIFLILDGLASIGSESSNKTEQLLVIKVMKRVTTSFYAKRQLTSGAQAEILRELSSLQKEIAPAATPTPRPTPTPKATPKHTPKPTPRTHNNR